MDKKRKDMIQEYVKSEVEIIDKESKNPKYRKVNKSNKALARIGIRDRTTGEVKR